MLLQRPDGETLAYRHSEGRGPGVMFCTGFNSNMGGDKALALEAWCRERGRQFTRFDYLGHGESSGRFEQGTIGRWRDDALAVLDEVTTGPQVIVGSSMGGWIMLLVALERPQRLAGLVGIATAADFTERLADRMLGQQQREQLAAQGFCEIENCYDDGEPYRIDQNLLREGHRHLLLGDRIAIDKPVRLIHGQRDEDVPWEISLEVAAQLTSDDVEVQLVKGGDHRLSSPRHLARLLRTLDNLLGDIETRDAGLADAVL